MLLEYGRVYGFPTYVLLILVVVFFVKDTVLLFLGKSEYSWIKYLLLPAFLGVYLYYALEPNGHLHKDFWTIGLFLNGMIRGWLELHSQPEHVIEITPQLPKSGTQWQNRV